MRITVILCTFNRCQLLAKALDSVAVSILPESVEWEVLVMDNNSIDQTREVVEDFCRQYPGRFRYLFEPRQGKSYALNSGIAAAKGDVLAFMDDDVTVEPTWLHNLTAPLEDGKWAGSGGRILPKWTCTAARWLPPDGRFVSGPLALFDLGAEPGVLTETPFGTNMAFQKKMFGKYGCFRTDLGPRPGSEIRNEDTEFGRRLMTAGEQLRYEPSAVVYHLVPQKRVQKAYFLAWWFDKARADIRESGIPCDARWSIFGIPANLFGRLRRWTFRWMVTVNRRLRFECKLKVWLNAGLIVECYHQSLSAKRRGIRATGDTEGVDTGRKRSNTIDSGYAPSVTKVPLPTSKVPPSR
jgi:glycosyltransferase involved in cell wall biosynthesis